MVNNYMCQSCNHFIVCKNTDLIDKFDSNSKKYIGVDITIESCKHYEACELPEEE